MRLFVGVPIPIELREKLQSVQKEMGLSIKGVFVSPENFHFTVKFLGDVRDERMSEICLCVQKAVLNYSPFPVRVSDVGAFPSDVHPHVVWVGASDNPLFVSLLTDMQQALGHFRKEDHQTPVPHLTLARVRAVFDGKRLSAAFEKFRSFDFGSFTVDRVVLYNSDLGREGPAYTVVREFVLGG